MTIDYYIILPFSKLLYIFQWNSYLSWEKIFGIEPTYIQDLFEQRLGGRGFGLHELGVLAATIEHLVHSEAITIANREQLINNN